MGKAVGKSIMKKPFVLHIDPTQIIVPPGVQRPVADKVSDHVLRRSIEQTGIQQPLVVLADGDAFLLIDGVRRLEIAKALGIPKVPAAVDHLPAGEPNADAYALRMRFILDEHRQDLLPSQKGILIAELKKLMKFSNPQIAAYLGVDGDSITNWLSVLRYIPPVQLAMDAGLLTMQAARVFDGMTDKGQETLWKGHQEELIGPGRTGAHKRLRKLFSPVSHPEFYRNAKMVAIRLKQNNGAKRKSHRPNYNEAEKKKLLSSLDMKEAQLAEYKTEISENKREIEAAGPIVSALLRDKKLRALIPAEMLPELERFAEEYC